MTRLPYASFIDSTTDSGGQAHAAWNENGVLLHAIWDPEAGRWGDAAQIANATSARKIQLTPGRMADGLPLLLATWESGEGNDANLFCSVGFHEGDGRVNWSDVVPFRTNGLADTNHRVGVTPDGDFVVSNEVRQSPDGQVVLDAAYHDSEIATTVLRVTRRVGSADGIAEDAVAGKPITILNLARGERLLRVLANDQWLTLADRQPVQLPRLGQLELQGTSLLFTPDEAFASSNGSVLLTFEKASPTNLLHRSSFEVFGDKAPNRQSFRLQLGEPGAAFENLPLGFSHSINREQISRDAFASLIPRRAGSAPWRELAGDGVIGDQANRAMFNRAQKPMASLSGAVANEGEVLTDPFTGGLTESTMVSAASSMRYQETYKESLFGEGTPSAAVRGNRLSGSAAPPFFDRYELAPNMPVSWNITLADISKSVDGALVPIKWLGESFGSNFQLGLTGSTAFVKTKDTVGYRSRMSLVFGDAIQIGGELKDISTDGAKAARRDIKKTGLLAQWRRETPNKDKRLTTQNGSLLGIPFLQRLSISLQTKAEYEFTAESGSIAVKRNPKYALLSLGIATTFGKEFRAKFGDITRGTSGSRTDAEGSAVKEYTFAQLRVGAGITYSLTGGIVSTGPDLKPGQGFEVLAYKANGTAARPRGILDLPGSRLTFNVIAWANVGKTVYGGSVAGLGGSNPKTDSGKASSLLLPGSNDNTYNLGGKIISGSLGITQTIPWIGLWGAGLGEAAASASASSKASRVSGFIRVDIQPQASFEASLFNRMVGLKGQAGIVIDGGVSGLGSERRSFYSHGDLYARALLTLVGIDYTLLNSKVRLWNVGSDPEEIDESYSLMSSARSGASVGVLDYVPSLEPALGTNGLNSLVRPLGPWPVVMMQGESADRIATGGERTGQIVRGVIVLPNANALRAEDLNGDGTIRNLCLKITSPGALKVVIDRRAFSGQPLAYDTPQPWQEILQDGEANAAERTLHTTLISGARPGERIPFYVDRRAVLDASGKSPELQVGLVLGDNLRYWGGHDGANQLFLPSLPNSPSLTERQGSSYVLGVQDIPRPMVASRSTDPYLAGLLLQSPGSGYRGGFDFVVDTGSDRGAQARAFSSPSDTAFLERIDLVRPGDSKPGSSLETLRSALEATLSGQNPFRTRLASGTTAQVSVRVNEQGGAVGLTFAPGDEGFGYLGGGDGEFNQHLDLGNRSLHFKVHIRNGVASNADLLGWNGTFTSGERFALNDDASGGGRGARLLPVVRDWQLLNKVDDLDLSIGSDLRYKNDGTQRSAAWLTYTQGAPIGAEHEPINSQGANINQPVRIGRFEEGNWRNYSLQKGSNGSPTPGVDGYNLNPVVAELTGTSSQIPDQVLVFSHADTSMIKSEDDLYLLEQALLHSDLYYSYRNGLSDQNRAFSTPKKLPILLPAGASLGLTNNRPYLTSFDNTGGSLISPTARDLPPSVLLAWLSSESPQSFDADVTIAVSIGSTTGTDIDWSPVDLIDPGDGISSDDIVNLSLTYQLGLPVLSWSVLTEQPYRAQLLEDKPLVYLRLDESTGSTTVSALGEQAGSVGQLVNQDRLVNYSSPLSFQLDSTETGILQSLDDGALWDATLGVGDPNQALRFHGGEYLELINPLALQALRDQEEAPTGYGIDLWVRPQADGNGRILDGSILDSGLYNSEAQLPQEGSIRLPFEMVRQASENEQGERGWRYVLQLKANTQANLTGVISGGLSPYNLATLLQSQSLSASFGTGPALHFMIPELPLNSVLTYQTREGALSNLFSGSTASEIWSEFRPESGISAEQVSQNISEHVDVPPLMLHFEQIPGWSLRQHNGELVFNWGEQQAADGSAEPLSLRSSALKPGEWNHVQLGYGYVDRYAPLSPDTSKRATLVINGQLVASADDLGQEITIGEERLLDYAGFDFNNFSLQLGYGFRGDLDEPAIFARPIDGLAESSQQRENSRFVNPLSASQATFFSKGYWDGQQWRWGDPDRFTYSAFLGASEPSIDRRAHGQQVIDLAGLSAQNLRSDGIPDAVIAATLPIGLGQGLIPLGSRLTGIRIVSSDGVYAVGDGIQAGETVSGLIGVIANNTPTNALLNGKQETNKLDLPVLGAQIELRLAYASRQDYNQGRGGIPAFHNGSWTQQPIQGYQAPTVSYFYRTPQQQLLGQTKPLELKAGTTAAVIANPSSLVLERGSSFSNHSLVAKAIVQREVPRRLSEINSGVQVTLQGDPNPANRFADKIEVGYLASRPYAAILNSQPDLEGGSSIVVLDLSAQQSSDLQKLRMLNDGDSSVAVNTQAALNAAGVKGLRIETTAGGSIGNTVLWVNLDGDDKHELIIGNPTAANGNGEVWILRGTYLQQVIDGSGLITLGNNLIDTQIGNVRRLRLEDVAGVDADRAAFGSSLAFGRLDDRGNALVIGAPSQLTGGSNNNNEPSRHGKVWALQSVDPFDANGSALALIASGATYASSGTNKPPSADIEFGASLAFAKLNGSNKPATLLVGLPGLEATYNLRNGGHEKASADQVAFYLDVLRTSAPRDTNPPATESVTVEAGGVLALDQAHQRQVLIVGQTFAGEAARAGEGLASGGSLDGDSVEDVAIGLPEEDNAAGAVAVIRGQVLRRLLDEAKPGQVAMGSLVDAGTMGLYVHGVQSGNRLGRVLRLDGNVVAAGQSNANELVIGNPRADDGTGEIHVLTGLPFGTTSPSDLTQANLLLDGTVFHQLDIPDPAGRLTLTPGRSYAGFGNAVALANVNGSASGGGELADLVMASSTMGSTFTVLYGKETLRNRDRLDLRDIASGQGLDFVVANQVTANVGKSTVVTDINGDGLADVLLGKGVTSLEMGYGASTEAGSSHPHAGTGGSASLDFEWQLARLQGSVVPNLPDGTLQSLRPQIQEVQAVGDLDGDGSSELWIRSGFRDRLLEGETLGVGESLLSANRRFILTMQADGNLVMYANTPNRRLVLFALDGGRFPTFKGSIYPQSTLLVRGGQLVYRRPIGSEEVLDFRTKYTRDDWNGNLTEVTATGPIPGSNLADLGMVILQDDGNLVGYGPEGPNRSTVVFALSPAINPNGSQPVDGAPINRYDPAAAPVAYQSLLFSGTANSNANLAAGQVLEAIDTSTLRSLGISQPGPYIGTVWMDGLPTLVFAHPQAAEVDANHLLLARQHSDYRRLFADTAGLLRSWGGVMGANAALTTLIEQIVGDFKIPASASLDDRYDTALINTDLAIEQLQASSTQVDLGLEFQQYLARQVPLYRFEACTLLDPSSGEPLKSAKEFVLADLNGDGSQELIVSYGMRELGVLDVATLNGAASTKIQRLSTIYSRGEHISTVDAPIVLRPIGDINGDGRQDLIGLKIQNYWGIQQVLYIYMGGRADDGTFLLNQGSRVTLTSNRNEAMFENISPDFLAGQAGDVNGDGVDDFLIEGNQGFYVVYGQSGGGAGLASQFDSSNAFWLSNPQEMSTQMCTFIANDLVDWSLHALSGSEDFNADGLSDIQVSLRSNKNPNALRHYVIFGGDFTQERTRSQAGTYPGLLTQSITQMGTIAFDSLRGTPAGDTLIGREGDDLLNGQGGPDVLNGGPGSDVAVVADDQFRRVDGGPGEDSLVLNGAHNQAWDLTRLASSNRIANIEIINIQDFGTNQLRLNAAAVQAMTDSRRILTIEGDGPKLPPLEQLMRLLQKRHGRYATEFSDHLEARGIRDEQLRIDNDGRDPLLIYGDVLNSFWSDYNAQVMAETRAVEADFVARYGDRYQWRNENQGWPPQRVQYDAWNVLGVLPAYNDSLATRVRPAFSDVDRDAIKLQLQEALNRADCVLLADGPNELRLDPNAPDLVLGSDRYWVYAALNGAAQLLVADGIQVLRSAEVSPGLIPTAWTQPSTVAVAELFSAEPTPEIPEQDAVPALFAAATPPAAAAPLGGVGTAVARARPEDQRFLVDTPVVSQSENRITFTVQRIGFLEETSRLAFRVLGYTAGLVPAGYGQVVFAPGETHRTLQVPLIKLDPNTELLPSSEVSVELLPLEAGAAGPRTTTSFAMNGQNAASQTTPNPVRGLPAEVLSPLELIARSAGLPLGSSLTSREQMHLANPDLTEDPEAVVFGVSSIQGLGANDVWLHTTDGRYLSIYDQALEGSLSHLQDSFEEQNGDLFFAISDGSLLDGDGLRDGSVDLTALPVLTSPGVVMLHNRVLRAPGRGDGDLWLNLDDVPETLAGAELLFIPVLDQDGAVPTDDQRLRPGDNGYTAALNRWIGSDPSGLRRLRLSTGSLSERLQLQADTDYRVLVLQEDTGLQQPTLSADPSSAGRSLSTIRLQGDGLDLTLKLSSNRWVMPGLAGAEPLLQARYSPGIGAEASPRQVALVRTDNLAASFDSDGDGLGDCFPGDPDYLSLLAARLERADGAVILAADQRQAVLPFTGGDPVMTVLFEGITAQAWLALPAEQQTLSGSGWRLWIDGQDDHQQRIRRHGASSWEVAGGASLTIDLAKPRAETSNLGQYPTRQALSGVERLQIRELGYDNNLISEALLNIGLAPRAPEASLKNVPNSWAQLNTAALAINLWNDRSGLGEGLAPSLLRLSGTQADSLNQDARLGSAVRFYSLNGLPYDTLALSEHPEDRLSESSGRFSIAATAYQPLLGSTEMGLSLEDASGGMSQPGRYSSDLTISLTPGTSAGLAGLMDCMYFLVPDPGVASDSRLLSRDALMGSGQMLFQTFSRFDDFVSRTNGEALFSTSIQLPVGSGYQLVALASQAEQGERLKPIDNGEPKGTVEFSGLDGSRIAIRLAASPAGIDDYMARDQAFGPGLNLHQLDRKVNVRIDISREASLQSELGLYRATDMAGGVVDPITQTILYPNDPGYEAAALSEGNTSGLPKAMRAANRNSSSYFAELDPGSVLFPYAITETGITHFPFAKANSDNIDRFRVIGRNRFGYEDLPAQLADLDYDDGTLTITAVDF